MACKHRLWLPLVLILGIVLSGCVAPTATPGASSEAAAQGECDNTLTFWNGFTGPDRPAVEALVVQYNESNSMGVTVEMDIQPWDSLLQKLLTSMTVGSDPDMAAFTFRLVPQYAEAGVLMPMDDLYGPDGIDPATLPPAYLDIVKHNGTNWAAPMNFATLMMYYNKDLFAAAGLDPETPPATWDEWTDAIQKLTQDTDGDGTIDQYGLVLADNQTIPMWPILVWGNGGDFLNAEGESMLLDPATLESFTKWGALVAENGISPVGLTGAEADKIFETGKAAMEMNGPWMTTGYTAAGLNYDVAPVPAGPGGQVTLADAVVIVANKNSACKDQIYDFIKFWNSPESQVYWAVNTGFPPARVDLADDPGLAQNPFVAKFAGAAPYARFYLAGLQEYAAIDGDILTPAIQAIGQGAATAEEALAEANAKLTELMTE